VVAANEDVVPASELRAAQQKIRELERLIGKKAVDPEILRAARDEVEKYHASAGCPRGDRPAVGTDQPGARDCPGDGVAGARTARPTLPSA
jgi:hypothetical protein